MITYTTPRPAILRTGSKTDTRYPSTTKAAIRLEVMLGACRAGYGDTDARTAYCALCAAIAPWASLHGAHVVPATLGGMYWPTNLLPACEACNGAMGDTDWSTFAAACGLVTLYDSRHDTDMLPDRRQAVALMARTLPVNLAPSLLRSGLKN